MSWKSTKWRKSTALMAIAALLAALLSLSSGSPAGAATSPPGTATLYELTCDTYVNALGNPAANIGPVPNPIAISSIVATPPDPVTAGTPYTILAGTITTTVLGAVIAGARAQLGADTVQQLPTTLNLESFFLSDPATVIETQAFSLGGSGALEGDSQAAPGASFLFDATGDVVTTADTSGLAVGYAFAYAPPEDLGVPATATITEIIDGTSFRISGSFAAPVVGRLGGASTEVSFTYPFDATGSVFGGASVGPGLGTWDTTGGVDGDALGVRLAPGGDFAQQITVLPATELQFLTGVWDGLNPPTAGACVKAPAGSEQIPGATNDAEFASAIFPIAPEAPVCTNQSVDVGLGATVVIDLNNFCTDGNFDLDPTTFVATLAAGCAGPCGTLIETPAGSGIFEYTSVTDPGGSDSFVYNVNDLALQGPSVDATITINVLASACDATSGACSLTQIVDFTITGQQLTFEQTDQFVSLADPTNPDGLDGIPGNADDGELLLSGQPKTVEGSLNDITVTNARGDAAGWTVTAYSTDYGTPGGPTVATPTGDVYSCSAGTAAGLGGPSAADRLCIPGTNTHNVIPGDVAAVTPGPASAANGAAWLASLIAGGLVESTDGLPSWDTAGNNTLQAELCTAADSVSGGTFGCDADLWLGVPASAGAGDYTGSIILTLT